MNSEDVVALLTLLDGYAESAIHAGQGDMAGALQVAMLSVQQGADEQGLDVPEFQGVTFGFCNG